MPQRRRNLTFDATLMVFVSVGLVKNFFPSSYACCAMAPIVPWVKYFPSRGAPRPKTCSEQLLLTGI